MAVLAGNNDKGNQTSCLGGNVLHFQLSFSWIPYTLAFFQEIWAHKELQSEHRLLQHLIRNEQPPTQCDDIIAHRKLDSQGKEMVSGTLRTQDPKQAS